MNTKKKKKAAASPVNKSVATFSLSLSKHTLLLAEDSDKKTEY